MISLCMIVKNEERNLARCLKSSKDCVDEMIIVDTGSEDQTIAIAEQFGAKIYHYQWQEDFASARNFSLDQAKGDWILYLDADEELEPNCAQRLRSLTENPTAEGYIFQIINLTDGNDPLKHVNVRMFRNKPQYRFEGKLHEQIITAISPRTTGSPVIYSGINILHYGYMAAEFIAKNKAQRNHRINMKLVEQDPNNPFYLYSLGGSCVNLNDLEGAVAHYRKALEHVNLRAMYAPSIFISLISCLLKIGNLDEAVHYLEQCKTHYPDYVDVHYIDGELFSQLGHTQRAIRSLEKCLQLGEHQNGRYTSRTGVGSFLAHFKLAEIYLNQKDHKKALEHHIKGLKLKNNDLRQYLILAKILKAQLNNGLQVYEVLKTNVKHQDQVAEKLLLARILWEIEEYHLAAKLMDEVPSDKGDIPYHKCIAFIKCGRYNDALNIFPLITDHNNLHKAVQELTIALWTSSQPINALPYLEQIQQAEEEFITVLKGINAILFEQIVNCDVELHNYYFMEVINELLNQKEFERVHKLLNTCNLSTPDSIISYLIEEPAQEGRFELAARLATHEFKKGNKSADCYYALARYLYNNEDYAAAQALLSQALNLQPAYGIYETLLEDINCKQTLNMVLEALKHYPDHPDFNRQLLSLQMKRKANTRLKGVH